MGRLRAKDAMLRTACRQGSALWVRPPEAPWRQFVEKTGRVA
jgi:hypothetical protein